jgi:outer membrane protein
MNSLTLKSLLAAGLLAAAAAGASAQELKIGYVNSDRVLRDAVPAKAAQAKLEAEFSKREKDLTDLGNRLKVASDRLDKDAPTLAESERTRRQRELVDQDRELQRKRREFQEDLSQRKNESSPAWSRGRTASSSRSSRRKVRPDPPGGGVLESEGGHHRQGHQGTERARRQVSADRGGS